MAHPENRISERESRDSPRSSEVDSNASEKPPPNVLILVSDQHHPRFMGCAGHPLLHTPNLDCLAARGTRFSSAYCNFPLCGPSRMSFLTGRYASEIDCICNGDHLRSDIPTFAHAFVGAGYDTILCGRMHFNGPDQRHGFLRRLAGDVTLSAFHRNDLRRVLGDLADTTGPHARSIAKSGPGQSGYLRYDGEVADTAVEWLRTRAAAGERKPFLMTVGFVQPHAPFVAPPEDYFRYDGLVSTEDVPSFDLERLHPEMRRLRRLAKLEEPRPLPLEDQRRARVAYLGMCTFLDRQVGRVLSALEQSGMGKDTIVVYISDHGEQLGEHGMWWKHTFYDASAGVPMLIAGPDLPRNRMLSRNVSLLDLGPTLLDLCQAPPIPGASGRSFATLLKNDADGDWPDRVIAENLWHDLQLHRMVRQGPWKLNVYSGMPPTLFNLEEDPGETCDLSGDPKYGEIIENLRTQLAELPDPAASVQKLGVRKSARAWIQEAFRAGDLDEPDLPWVDTENAPENHHARRKDSPPRTL